MLGNDTLASSGEQLTQLDDDALAAIVGGLGPVSWFLKEVGKVLLDCLEGGLDAVISAAEEGYDDARAS